MTPLFRSLIPVAALVALGACDSRKPAPTKATAEGEILEGSVSDAMLPLDTVRSQPPLAPREETGDAGSTAPRDRSQPRGRAAEPAAPEAPAADAPAAADEVTPAEE